MKIGVISDTHGHMDAEALEILRGSDLIFHLGDIGSADVIAELEKIAPVRAVAGNHEPDDIAGRYGKMETFEAGGKTFLLSHGFITFSWEHINMFFSGYMRKVNEMKFDCLVYGHSHYPSIKRMGARYFFNPGYAGPDTTHPGRAVGLIEITGGEMKFKVIKLKSTGYRGSEILEEVITA